MIEKISIKLLVFGAAKEITGYNEAFFDNVKTLENLRTQLFLDFPELEKKSGIQFAINEEYVNNFSVQLKVGDVIALIPPVSGG